jgi:hypothetical protein
MTATAPIDWTQTYRERAARSAERAQAQGIEVHDLDTIIGRVFVTFEECEHDRLAGTLWTDAPVRVNHHDWRICARYQYFLSPGHWENRKRITHDPPIPCASFPSSDMLRAGDYRATSNANHKAEAAIGAAIAALDVAKAGLLRVQATRNATELAAQEQEQHASRARARAAEWVAHAERHARNAVALRAGETPSAQELTERRVW